ncbi:hypothetical protein [Sphingomonas sp. CARO-RG-8B-R24-01]|uniref:hypothetical protein n=1 Tax=Sphingomonas sp. CARO-RG-8B-R24-01 TaxID=2914831 RepID=UPI001F57C62A|nr:hypothetical protein [Sphingomonas sp. CARO-RG-8B-R24-01]
MPTLFGLPVGWAAIFGLFQIVLGGGVLASWIKNRPKMREIERNAETKLRDDLIARVERLETRVEETRSFYERKIERLQADYEAAQRIARHELANAKMRFRALIMLLKRLPDPPDGLAMILIDIENMELEQAKNEALEKGVVSAAKITSVAPVT